MSDEDDVDQSQGRSWSKDEASRALGGLPE
jgi:hypothetical protein